MPINLTATNQKLKVITSQAVQTQVVASGRDNVGSAQTPISQDTNIPTAATTDIVAVPGTSTQRLVDDVEISIVGSGTQQVTVQKDVGGTAFQLYTALLNTGDRVHFTNDGGWRTFAFGGQEKGKNVGFSLIKAPTLLTSGTSYTPSVNCTAVLIELWGGGGQGGGSGTNTTSNAAVAPGGNAGGYVRKFLIGVPSSFTYAIGAAGTTGTGTTAGQKGGDTTATINGVVYTATGGNGGTLGLNGTSFTSIAAAAAVSGTNGDENLTGDVGTSAIRFSGTQAISGSGGESTGGIGGAPGQGGVIAGTGAAASGFNAGGAGGLLYNTAGSNPGGAGAPGCMRAWEFTS